MAGKKISRANMAHIHAAADHLHQLGANYPGKGGPDNTPIGKADMSLSDQIQAVASAVYRQPDSAEYPYVDEVFDTYVIIEIGEAHYRADYTTAADGAVTLAARDTWMEVEEVWTPVSASAKAGLLMAADSTLTPYASLKALSDRQIEVKVAYYGHKNGVDSHGEYFSAKTDFDAENFPTPPLLYYHGYSEDGKKMGKPAVTGNFVSRRAGSDGHYLTYKLRNTKYADRQWDAALKGACVVSPGTIGHLIRKAADGHLDYWPLAEVSAWDYAANRKPANLHSVAAPVLKALYLEEGLTLPAAIERTAPETGGEPVSAGADDTTPDISPDEAARYIVAQVAGAVFAKNRG